MRVMHFLLCLILALGLPACGGGGDDGAGEQTAVEETEGAPEAVETPAPETDASAGEAAIDLSKLDYRTNHDPDAVYTYDDIPDRGGYRKLDFEDLSPEALNRVLHRFMTEPATCEGCEGMTIDEALVNLGECPPCILSSKAIIREELARAGG